MQMCPFCNLVYDASEYSKCPRCHKDDDVETINIVYDKELGVLELTDAEYEEFKKTHPDYH